jgi:AmmeMemoRadiSam system protein A
MAALDDESRKHLLRVARSAIARAIGAAEPRIAEPSPVDRHLIPRDLRAGAFVTLRMHGQLRGCIGYPDSELPLLEVVGRCAVSAAISDPRFPAVNVDEWRDIDLEISVLGPLEEVADLSQVVVGRHGLVVELGRRRGLLLPQVATEWNWTVTEFVSQTCLKAGLPRDAWRSGATLYRFEAQVFGEIKHYRR